MYLDRAAWIKTLICSIKLAKKNLAGRGYGSGGGGGGRIVFMNFWSLRPIKPSGNMLSLFFFQNT